MARIKPLSPVEAGPASRTLLDGVQKSLGMIPNLLATVAHSPAALRAYLGFNQALGGAELSPAIREQISVAVAGVNSCGYCASAHTQLGKNVGVSEDELALNLRGESSDPRARAAIDFARAIVVRRGWVEAGDLAGVRDAGFSEGEIVEIVAAVAINVFTNYFNHIAETEIDFPEVTVPEPLSA